MNDVYRTMFAEPFPARSTFQVAGLPGGADVEIECIAVKR
jgi:2-iminobutanoate/2-iminopropanoate deaminase